MRAGLAVALALAVLSVPAGAAAKHKKRTPEEIRLAHITSHGRPTVKLDALDFPADLTGAKHFRHYLKKRLEREVRHAHWGAGRNNVIEYRFKVTELAITTDGDILHVRCSAVGKLPGGQNAKSRLSFGGDARKRNQLIERVLDIVARGVVTRLAELERIRRGDLDHSRVRTPINSDTQ